MGNSLKDRIERVKKVLPSEDVMAFEFASDGGAAFALIYADGIVDKNMMGELVVKPLKNFEGELTGENVKKALASPELKDGKDFDDAIKNISDGNAVLYIDGVEEFYVIGVKSPPGRAVAEPPTQVVIKGPREGFTEDIKVNLGLVRKRLKSDKLVVKTVKVGKRSDTSVAICYLDGVCAKGLPEKIEKQILNNEIDIVPDSSYVAGFISKRPRSLFKRNATCEKPDIFCAKVSEGRVGIIVDGSPIAVTVPYMLIEDFQSAEDYYAVSYRSTILRVLRVSAILIGMILPAEYVCAQLFKIQLIPPLLLFKIASSVAGIPLSPSVEIFLTLFLLEVLNEASIRMPKYVGLALSVVGALVLGDTAVKAGIISTPAVIIIAFSAICLYTVPDLVETSTTLRLIFLIVAGSLGTFGLLLTIAFLICYLVTEQDYGVPLLSPYAPMIAKDMRDGLLKSGLYGLDTRPEVFKLKNKKRLRKK